MPRFSILGALVLLALVFPGGALGRAISPLWIVLVIRSMRIRFVADDHGVTVANLMHTRRIPWDEIDSMTTGPAPMRWQAFGGRMVLQIDVTDGTRVVAVATSTPADQRQYLFEDLDPVAEIADAHGVRSQWRDLDAGERRRIDRTMHVIGAASRPARLLVR